MADKFANEERKNIIYVWKILIYFLYSYHYTGHRRQNKAPF